ncbi:COG4 transport protein-domain-containing protein [Cyathus striatus]|nr:COG4 transport protein-domain-containing protein [Cyathus striatus]
MSLTRLQSLSPTLKELQDESYILSKSVRSTAAIAERVGGRVRLLDQEMGRVKEAMDRVGQVIELKASLAELQVAINSQDWETAARHCSRIMSLPDEVISGAFAEIAVPTGDNPSPPHQVLRHLKEKLLYIFRENFKEATKLRDSTATSRFFKLFPSIGFEEEGLQAYSTFVTELVLLQLPTSAKTSPFYYINTLVALFESIAKIVDQHQPIVEKYYGPGKMNRVIQRLLAECDSVIKASLESWEADRFMKRKLADIKESPLYGSNVRRAGAGPTDEEEVIDPRDIDKVVSELASMAGRWNLFRKFLSDLSKDGEPTRVEGGKGLEDCPSVVDLCASLDSSASGKMFETLLTTYYTPFELWYVKSVVNKAHRLSSPDLTQTPIVNTAPDDVFYILKSVFSRILSTGSEFTVKHTVDQLRILLENDYIGTLKKKMDEVYRNVSSGGTATRSDKAEKENKIVFVTLLNDFDISSSHLERLIKNLTESSIISHYFLDSDQARIMEYILSVGILGNRIQSVLRAGIEQLFNQLIRPKLRNLIPELYKDVTYVLDDDGYITSDHHDLVRRRFVKTWDQLMNGYKEMFSEGNYHLLLTLVLDAMLRPWEKFVLSLRFTELGAIRFDHDLRSIITFLSSQTILGDVRERYVKLQQISTLLNLDSDENVNDFYNSSGIIWKLTYQEAQTVLALKL